jgi:hypothetical protein
MDSTDTDSADMNSRNMDAARADETPADARTDSSRTDSWTSHHRRRAIWARERAARATDPSAASTFADVANFWSALADWADRLQARPRAPKDERGAAKRA